jgi:uroporphyrin-III C-methyltransferase/precorrin-2 dehydrogenase/sirohydrochlorin ferrochelatase
MKYFPIFLEAEQLNILIIGGGEVAARKIELLLKATSNITIVSNMLTPMVNALVTKNKLTWLKQTYQPGLMVGKNIVIAATDDMKVNKAISVEAKQLGIQVNVVDQPQLCSYITPAIIDRSPMIVAISSSGSSPVLVRMLREELDKMLPEGYGKLAEFCFKFREHVQVRVEGVRNRRLFWENALQGRIGQLILNGDIKTAEQQLIASLSKKMTPPDGEIIFIHTQEGDPDNLTLKAHRQLQFADSVLYDGQVNPALIEYVRRDADKYPQDINSDIMINFQHAIELAEQGQKVIYLLAGHIPLQKNIALQQSEVHHQVIISGN